jgi:pimeloyl-ACP methyl ester carboxylesterase
MPEEALAALFRVVFGVLFGVLIVYFIGGYLVSRQAVGEHPEWRKMIATPAGFGLDSNVIEFPSKDGIPLKAWWLPAEDARAVIVLAHGSGGNRSHMLSRAAFLVNQEFSALIVDLRNHGESSGTYMTQGYLEALDILGAIDYLRQKGEQRRIILLGHSYGAVASLHAAAQSQEVSAVIADAAFISYSDMMSRVSGLVMKGGGVSLALKMGIMFMRLPFLERVAGLAFRMQTGVSAPAQKADALASIPKIAQPVLFIAGEKDPIAPVEVARMMFEKAPNPKKAFVILPGATHQTYKLAPREYETAVLGFLDAVLL